MRAINRNLQGVDFERMTTCYAGLAIVRDSTPRLPVTRYDTVPAMRFLLSDIPHSQDSLFSQLEDGREEVHHATDSSTIASVVSRWLTSHLFVRLDNAG